MVENSSCVKYSTVLHTYHCDKETDADSDGILQRGWHHVEDDMSHVAHAKQGK